MLKLDLHIHSRYSEDAQGSPKEIIKILMKKGLDGMAVTDHNNIKGGLEALKVAPKDFIVIPGVEISTSDGHILAYNIKKNIPRGLTVEDTIEKIKAEGGTPVVPHVLRNMSGIKKEGLNKIKDRISAIEVFNSCSTPQTNLKTIKIAKNLNLGGTGGSDAHIPKFTGEAYTVVNTNEITIDAILNEIEKKKTWGKGKSLPFEYRQHRMIKSIKQFFTRGLKRI